MVFRLTENGSLSLSLSVIHRLSLSLSHIYL